MYSTPSSVHKEAPRHLDAPEGFLYTVSSCLSACRLLLHEATTLLMM